MKFSEKDINKLSFSDSPILSINFFEFQKSLKIQLDGAWLEKENDIVQELGQGHLLFLSWKDFQILKYDHLTNSYEKDKFEAIKEICEFEYSNNIYIIRGFGKISYKWVEYRIYSPILEIEFQETIV